ncbi:endosomal protein P24B [[Candida] jaroonii]|uniref:Endosomal protein P24B n=1 Tax=[Candida] jaroonii TaxID=467808 RepID=A0ACA9Y3Q3_9ASCO|nr:endosomal protein P24B [[Candida] jaroonii]
MHFKTLFIFYLVSLINCHNILLPPYGKQCFFENLRKNDELSISYQVGSRDPSNSEQLKASFSIGSPNGQIIVKRNDVDHGDENLKAAMDGRYLYCFSNEKSSRVDLDVSFNVHGVVYIDLDNPDSDTLDYAIKRLSQLTSDVKAEQSYLVIRERTHRNTAESTNSRVKWWSVFQIIVVIANSLFQIYYLRRFFEVKSVV